MPTATAILLFSRSALAEAGILDFGNERANLRVSSTLLQRTLATLKRSGLPVYHTDERSQYGTRFGERLTNAMAGVFARGHDRVIVVGSDCPALSVRHLRRAVHCLEAGRPVLGPDHRGGIWLLGCSRHDFRAGALRCIAWQSDQVFTQLQELFPAADRLTRLADINGRKDLAGFWYTLRSLVAGLHSIIAGAIRPADTHGLQQSDAPAISDGGRAPPLAA